MHAAGAPCALALPPGVPAGVAVWKLDLSLSAPSFAAARACLSPAELEHYGRFRHREDAWRFALTRATLRELLGQRLDMPAREVPLERDSWGKPRLAGSQAPCFSVSYARHAALIAVSTVHPVGVDIECATRPFPDEVVRHVVLPSTASDDPTLYAAWTAKEAVLKAWGCGLHEDAMSLYASPGGCDRFILCFGNAEVTDTLAWRLEVGAGYAAAIAIALRLPAWLRHPRTDPAS